MTKITTCQDAFNAVEKLIAAEPAPTPEDQKAQTFALAGLTIARQFSQDINRIAVALEKLANPEKAG